MLTLSLHPNEAIHTLLRATTELKLELQQTTIDNSASLVQSCRIASETINVIKQSSLIGDLDQLHFHAERLSEHIDYVEDVAKLVRHVVPSEHSQIRAKHAQINLHVFGPQLAIAAETLCKNPDSNQAMDNMDMFCGMFSYLENEVLQVSQTAQKHIVNQRNLNPPLIFEHPPTPSQKVPPSYPGAIPSSPNLLNITRTPDLFLGPLNKSVPNLQAPNLHSNPNKLNTLEFPPEYRRHSTSSLVPGQYNSSKSMRHCPEDVLQSYKNVENNEMVKRAKKMAQQADDMFDFTRGQGKVKSTQDLFTLAEYFAEEANMLYKVVRLFSYDVPSGEDKRSLMAIADDLPKHCHQLQMLIQTPIVGKAATFTKVDSIIKETKQIKVLTVKIVDVCFLNAEKYNLDFSNVSLENRNAAHSSDEQPFGSSTSLQGAAMGDSS